jgi:hypothetical protein
MEDRVSRSFESHSCIGLLGSPLPTETTEKQPPIAGNRIPGRRIVSGLVGRSGFTQIGHGFSNCLGSPSRVYWVAGHGLARIATGTARFRFWPPSTEDRVLWVPGSAPSLPISDSPSPNLSVSSLSLSVSLLSQSLDVTLSLSVGLARRRTEEEGRKKKNRIRKKEEWCVRFSEVGGFIL